MTALLAWLTPGLSVLMGVVLGLVAARRSGRADHWIRIALIIGCALGLLWLPAAGTIWVAAPLVLGSTLTPGAPLSGPDWLTSALVPLAIVLVWTTTAIYLRVRAAARELSGEAYLLTLRSRGRPTARILGARAVRGALPFILTVELIAAVTIVGGALTVPTTAASLPRVISLLLAFAVTMVLVGVAAGIRTGPPVAGPPMAGPHADPMAAPAAVAQSAALASTGFRASDHLDVRELRLRLPIDEPAPDVTGSPWTTGAGLSLTVTRGQSIALIGDEFSGAAELGRAIAALSSPATAVLAGSILVDGQELVGLPEGDLNRLRGRRIGHLGAPSAAHLDPETPVGRQVVPQTMWSARPVRADAHSRAIALLTRVGVPEAAREAESYPHELSPLTAHRVLVAGALAAAPELLIAEDPTRGLGFADAAAVQELLFGLQAEFGFTFVLTSSTLDAARRADRVAVLHRGQIVEHASFAELTSSPRHPLSRQLLRAFAGEIAHRSG